MVAYLATTIANETGMRGVELRNLRLGDIDVDSRTLKIGTSKNESGLRNAMLTNDATKAVLKLLDRAAMLGRDSPRTLPNTSEGEGWIRPEQTDQRLANRMVVTAQGSRLRDFRFHDLQHTFITTHAEIGTPLPVLSALAGHLSKRDGALHAYFAESDATGRKEFRASKN